MNIDDRSTIVTAHADAPLYELAARLVRDGMLADARVIYSGRNTLFTVNAGERVACVKAFRRVRFIKGVIYGFFRRSKARSSFENASRLRSMGFDSPAPLAYCETRTRLGLYDRGYYICDYHPELVETRCWERWPDRDAFVGALGREMGRLADAGVLFEDFSPGNVMCRRGPGGGYEFWYVDVNRTRFDVWSRRRLMSMFKRINIVEAETARLARAFARDRGEDPARVEAEALGVLRRFLFWKDHVQKPVKRFFKRLFQ